MSSERQCRRKIGWLDVSMHDSFRMGIFETTSGLHDVIDRLLNRERSILLHKSGEIAALDILHHEKVDDAVPLDRPLTPITKLSCSFIGELLIYVGRTPAQMKSSVARDRLPPLGIDGPLGMLFYFAGTLGRRRSTLRKGLLPGAGDRR